MVLERIVDVKKGRKNPLIIFFLGVFVSVISLFISYTVFKENTGLFTVVILSLVLVPFMNSMLVYEEKETEETGQRESFFQRHGDVILAYAALFIGMTLAMSVIFVVLPENVVQTLFDQQVKEVKLIQGKYTFGNQLIDILVNNVSVLMLAFLFSFLIGTGAILILAWNSSVLSAAIGLIAKNFGGIGGIPVAVLTFIPHGSFEILAYLIGAIAGGLISAAVVRKKSNNFWYIIKDSLGLLVISFVLLVIGAIVETVIIVV